VRHLELFDHVPVARHATRGNPLTAWSIS
jgi:hypothetical protein